jgi:uncharacterized protein DUF6510
LATTITGTHGKKNATRATNLAMIRHLAAVGSTIVIGALAVYMHGMGTVVRCPVCDNMLIRIAHAKGYWLDMRGVRVLQIRADA